MRDVRDGCAIHGAFEEFCPNCEWVDEDTEADDTRREDEPGDWFVADFDGECSRGECPGFMDGDNATVRADGNGGWECRVCVEFDRQRAEIQREAAS